MGTIFKLLLPVTLLGLLFLTPVEGKRWLTYLPDSQKLNTLAFLGTHDTASYGTFFAFAQTQSYEITRQLEAGIRVFDMRVRLISDVFAMHHDLIYLNIMFGELVRKVRDYLQRNPKEFVIMLMQEEHWAEACTMSECDILEKKYLKDWPNIFVQRWSIEDTIGEHRGKILLARANRGFWGCVTGLPCKEQNRYELNGQYGLTEKKNDIKALQAEVSATKHDFQCYINYLSGNGGAMYTPREIASVMDNLMVSEFRNPQNTLYIVMADFPSQALIDRVIDSNGNMLSQAWTDIYSLMLSTVVNSS